MGHEARVKQILANEGHNIVTTVNVGAKNGSTVSAVEYGNNTFHRTVLTLASTPVTTNGGATNAIEYGGVKLYDFPAVPVLVVGGKASLTIAMDSTMQTYFNDATPEGDVSIGSSIADSAAALGSSDTSDDDMVGATAYTMAAYAVATAVTGGFDQALTAVAAGTLDANVSLTVDASERDATQALTLLLSGTVELLWVACSA